VKATATEPIAVKPKRGTIKKGGDMFSKINGALTALVTRFDREDGQALAEYGLLLALIAVVCILALTALGLAISGTLGSITGAL
jgi:pilus assembly protein Flp/PilA